MVNDVYKKTLNNRKQIYISLGTVNNQNNNFYRNCINAFKNYDIDVVMSVGKDTDIKSLEDIPNNFCVKNSVNQIKVLQNSDAFITHCGMNSVNESLYYGVPMILFPQQSEQRMIANRVLDLGAGIMLKKNNIKDIKKSTLEVVNNDMYKENAIKLSKSFKSSGGAKKASDAILNIIDTKVMLQSKRKL